MQLTATGQSPWLLGLAGIVGAGLLYVLIQEVRKIPARLFTLMATAFLDMAGVLMIIPLMPFYVKELAGDDGVRIFGVSLGIGTLIGIIVSAFTIAQLASAPMWGRYSDKHGRRPALLIALGASAISYLIFGFATSLVVLFLSRLVQGAGGGTVGVIQAYVADSTEPADRARALGWLSAATNLGVALGPVLGSLAVTLGQQDLWPGASEYRMGRAAPGVVAALLCLTTMGFAWKYLKESRHDHVSDKPRPSSRAAAWRVLSHSSEPASRLILIYAIAIGAFQGVNTVLALFLNRRFGVTAQSIGVFFMYIGAISVFTRVLLLGRAVDHFGEARLSRIGITLLTVGLLGMPLAPNIGVLAIAVALLPLGTAFTFPCVTALLSRVIPNTERGLYMGLQQTFGGASRVIAPLFFGWSFDAIGTSAPYFFSASFVAATLLLGIGMDRYSAKPTS
ncbi:MAG: MFS transporter [Gemmatimonadetes bacterium]|nr:MFS transporter [Gemmatimonadota bacterium]